MSGNVQEGQEISPSLHLLGLIVHTLQLYECENDKEVLDAVTNIYWNLGLICQAMKMPFKPTTLAVPDASPNYLLDIRDIYLRASVIGGYITSYNLFAVPLDIIAVRENLEQITLSLKNILVSTKIKLSDVYTHLDTLHPKMLHDNKAAELSIEKIRQQIRRFDKSSLNVYNNLDDAAVASLVINTLKRFNPRLKRYLPIKKYVKKLRRVCELFCVYVNGENKVRPRRKMKRNRIHHDRYRGIIP